MFDFFEILGVFSSALAVTAAFSLITLVVGVVLFILKAIGIFKMSKAVGNKNEWLAFVPIVSDYAMGKVAEKYQKTNGKKSEKLGFWMILLRILVCVMFIVLIIFTILAVVSLAANATAASNNNQMLTLSDFAAFIPVIVFYFITIALEIVFAVFYYISFWRIISLFSKSNANLFLVLSILFPALAPIFILAVSKNRPQFTYEETNGFIISKE